MTKAISAFIDEALDRSHAQLTGKFLSQVHLLTNAPSSKMQMRLRELDEEADRLSEAETRMRGDNAYLVAALQDYESALDTTATLLRLDEEPLQREAHIIGVRATAAKVFTGLATAAILSGLDPVSSQVHNTILEELQRSGIPWTASGADKFVRDYISSPAWVARLNSWGQGYADRTRQTLLRGIQQGWSPHYLAAQLRQQAQNVPLSAATQLSRTLMLTAYRDANTAMESVNNQYIRGKVRLATLDGRTCLNCIALHGTALAPGERVDDHPNGRCDAFYQVVGGDDFPEFMQADSLPGKRRFVPFQTGEEWFAGLSPERQQEQASFVRSPSKYKAWVSGAVRLSDFSGEHHDAVFGRQTVERSLIKILGQTSQ